MTFPDIRERPIPSSRPSGANGGNSARSIRHSPESSDEIPPHRVPDSIRGAPVGMPGGDGAAKGPDAKNTMYRPVFLFYAGSEMAEILGLRGLEK